MSYTPPIVPLIPVPTPPPADATLDKVQAFSALVQAFVAVENFKAYHRALYDGEQERLAIERRHQEMRATQQATVAAFGVSAPEAPLTEREWVQRWLVYNTGTVSEARAFWAEMQRQFQPPTPIPR